MFLSQGAACSLLCLSLGGSFCHCMGAPAQDAAVLGLVRLNKSTRKSLGEFPGTAH